MEESLSNLTETSTEVVKIPMQPTQKAIPSTKNKKLFIIPRNAIKSLITSLSPSHSFQKQAIESLHYASEIFLQQLFEDSSLITTHCKRKTLLIKDMKLAQRIRGFRNF